MRRCWKFLIVFSLLCSALTAAEADVSLTLTRAYEAYLRGEQAETIEARSKAFNEAIRGYHSIAQDFADGRLYYNLANCYFQVGELPWSVLYYYKAQRLLPRDARVQENLVLAEERLGVEPSNQTSLSDRLLFFHRLLAERERHAYASLCVVIAVLAWSLYIWQSKPLWRSIRTFCFALAALLGFSLFYTAYLEPIEAVITRSETLRMDAGHHYAAVENTVLISGLKVEVLDVLKEGYWIKVEAPGGAVGYVPHDSVEMI